MLKRLSSMQFAFWAILCLIFWMGLGALLTIKSSPYYDVFSTMNEQMITQWLASKAANMPVILGWFIGLCLIAAALLLNTSLCIWQRILPMLQAARLSRNILAVVHILVILVMAGHGLSMIMGEKYESSVMFPGQIKNLGGGYSLRMDSLVFLDDPALLRLSKHDKHLQMTRDVFHLKGNHAILMLQKDGRTIERSTVGILAPFDHGSLHIVLKTFILGKKNNKLGALIIIVRNPLANPFFIIYALMITTLAWYVFITWKKPVSPQA